MVGGSRRARRRGYAWSLVGNDESVSVPEENLYAVASATKEHEQVAFVPVDLSLMDTSD